MTLREELYNMAHEIRVKEDAARSNVHKTFADIYLEQQCRIAAEEGRYAVMIDGRTTLADNLPLTEHDLRSFANEKSLDFDVEMWELCFTKK